MGPGYNVSNLRPVLADLLQQGLCPDDQIVEIGGFALDQFHLRNLHRRTLQDRPGREIAVYKLNRLLNYQRKSAYAADVY